MVKKAPVIAIDGPAASGKGTLAKSLAKLLDWHQLDSGLLYRIVAILSKQWNVSPDDSETLASRLQTEVNLTVDREKSEENNTSTPSRVLIEINVQTHKHTDPLISLDGTDITESLRTQEISTLASRVAKHPQVRQSLIGFQRTFRRKPGLIADGRDMGTVVFPDAELKIFLDADVLVRARRRFKQYVDYRDVLLSEIVEELKNRDTQDMARDIAPLKPAEDAVLIDNTETSIDALVEQVMEIVRPKFIRV